MSDTRNSNVRMIGRYLEHLVRNWRVALFALGLALFHFAHGLFPCRLTDHNRYPFWAHNGKYKEQ